MEPIRTKVGGKFSFKNLPKSIQNKVLARLAEKDAVMAQGLTGVLPGIKIDGKEVTKDNINDFKVHPKPLDLNRDGVVDKKDASLAGKVLAESKKLEKLKKESVLSKVKKAVTKSIKKKKK